MTMVVLGIMAIPLALLVSQHLESVLQSQDHTLAVNLARFEMEMVNNMNYTDPKIAVGTHLSPDYPAYNYDVTRTVACIQGDCTIGESLKRVTVTVTKKGSSAVSASLATYLVRNITYGI